MKGLPKELLALPINGCFPVNCPQEDYNSLVVTVSKLNGSRRRFIDDRPTTFVIRSISKVKVGIKTYYVLIYRYEGVLKKKGRRYIEPERINPLMLD